MAKLRDQFIEEQYVPIKIKSIKHIKNTETVYDLTVKDDGTYCVANSQIIGSNSDMGNKAKLIREFFRQYARKIEKYKIAMLVTNHYTQKIGVMFGPSKVTTGGTGLPYAASVRLDLKIEETEIDKKLETLGASAVKIKATTIKNRCFSPKRKISFVLDFEKGVNQYSGLLQILLDLGVATKSGGWHTFPAWDKEKKFYAKDFPSIVEENNLFPVIQEELDKAIHKGYDDIDIEAISIEENTVSNLKKNLEEIEDRFNDDLEENDE